MAHDCDDCGTSFDTLTRLRLHDCPPSDPGLGDPTGSRSSAVGGSRSDQAGIEDIGELDAHLAAVRNDHQNRIHDALATYDAELVTAHESGHTDRYRALVRAYEEPLVDAFDDAVRTAGWSLLTEAIETYSPNGGEIPEITTVLQNVAGRQLVRTRRRDGVAVIPGAALEYYASLIECVGDDRDLVREGLHPYGWGIGHPEHPVADRIHACAVDDVFLANPLLEHAFYADEAAAITLLERIVADDAVDRMIADPTREFSAIRWLLDAPAGAESEYGPTVPRYWDVIEEIAADWSLSSSAERRIRDIVTEQDLDGPLPTNWAIADLQV